MSANTLLWLLPVGFLLHDLEEILLFRGWLDANAQHLRQRLPTFASRILNYLDSVSTPMFAIAAGEEFLLLTILTFLSFDRGWYDLWAGIALAFAIHILVHITQAAVLLSFIPGLATGILSGTVCLAAVVELATRGLLSGPAVILWTGIAIPVIAGNLLLAHALAGFLVRKLKW
jgi:hypothetical protein